MNTTTKVSSQIRRICRSSCILILTLVALVHESAAQSCSCGGPPLLTSLDSPATDKGTLRLGVTYRYHSIADLFNESTELNDRIRDRSVQSGLIEIDYGISRLVSLAVILSRIQQQRTTTVSGGLGEQLNTRGFGDAIVLLKYGLVPQSPFSSHQLSIGGGIKVPLGKNSLRSTGQLISADMQPGTGAWDGIFWAAASEILQRENSLSLFASTTYRFTGTSDRFGPTFDEYQFGNEFQATLGISSSRDSRAALSAGLQYRSTTPDRFAGNALPNSGGRWLNFEPGLAINVLQQWAIRLEAKVPMYRKLQGTQFSTSYALGFSIFHTLSKNEAKLLR